MRPTRWVVAVLAALLVFALSVPAASAGGPAPPFNLSITSGNSGWIGQRVFASTPEPRALLSTSIAPGKGRWALLRLLDQSSARHTYLFTGARSGPRFAVTYMDSHRHDVTADVTGAGEPVSIGAGHSAYLLLRVDAVPGLDTGATATFWVRAALEHGGAADMVRLRVTVPPVKKWVTSFNGHLRCSATFPHRYVAAGSTFGVQVRVTNLLKHTVRFADEGAMLLIRDADGDVLFRTGLPGFFSGPPPFPVQLQPHASTREYVWDTRVRWSGPLTVQVECGGVRGQMPPVTVNVTSPGPPASTGSAIDQAVAVPGSPFQSCHPGSAGQPAMGVLPAPDGSTLPAMGVRCWATVTVGDGFDDVVLHLVSPGDAPAYTLDDDLGLHPRPPRTGPNYEAATWGFVVTSQGARPYVSEYADQVLGTGPGGEGYELSHGTWVQADRSGCGYYSFTYSTSGAIFPLDWITGCHYAPARDARAPRPGAGSMTTKDGVVRRVRYVR